MSKNDRVPALPSEERLAQVICDFLDRDSVEVNPPADPDYELARIIRNEFATAAYLAHVYKYWQRIVSGCSMIHLYRWGSVPAGLPGNPIVRIPIHTREENDRG